MAILLGWARRGAGDDGGEHDSQWHVRIDTVIDPVVQEADDASADPEAMHFDSHESGRDLRGGGVIAEADDCGVLRDPVAQSQASPEAALPANRRSFEWRYFATIDEDDNLATSEPDLEGALAALGYCISQRLISL